jgi:hypothetical protein
MPYQYKPELPNSTLSLVLGILSIPTCFFCYGVVGLPLAIVALIFGKRAVALHREDPTIYKGHDNAQAEYVLGIIGIVLNGLYVFFILMALLFSLSTAFVPTF